VSFVNAAYPCYERGGVPTCPGFRPKENMREIVDRRAQIARGNEGYKKPKEIWDFIFEENPKEIWDFIFWRQFWIEQSF
jgi:hypothetical protein